MSLVVLMIAWSALPLAAAHAEPSPSMPETLSDAPDAQISASGEPKDEGAEAAPAESSASRASIRFAGELVGALAVGFASDITPTSFGYGLTYGVGWGPIPLLLGIDFMSVNAGDESRTISLELPPDHGSLPANKSARDRTMYFDLWLRVQPPRWPVRPYVEGFIGTKLVQTRYSLSVQPSAAADGAANPTTDVVSDHAWAGSYGWGAGVDLWGVFNAGGAVTLTIGVRQLSGAEASFRRELLVAGQHAVARYAMPTTVTIFMAGIKAQVDWGAEPDPYAANGL